MYAFIMVLHLFIQVFPMISHLFICPYSVKDTVHVLFITFFNTCT